MKHIKLFENFMFENLNSENKILITLSSANSGGAYGRPTPTNKSNAESWSLGFATKYNITELCKKIGENTNQRYTEIFAGLYDELKFGRDYENYLTGISKKTMDEIYYEAEEVLFDDVSNITQLNSLKRKFQVLTVDDKINFLKKLEEIGFLIVRDSYIYLVIDESEFNNICEKIMSI